MKIVRTGGAFVAAVAATGILGSIAATQFVLAELSRMQIPVPFGLRVETTVHDILGMAPTYSAIVAGAFLLAFPVAAQLRRLLPLPRKNWLMIGGFASLVATLLLIRMLLGGTPVAGARGVFGLAAQGAAGLVGGWLFARLTAAEDVKP
jgi:hypothetical protein